MGNAHGEALASSIVYRIEYFYLPLFERDDGRFLDAGDIANKLPYEIMEKGAARR